MINGPCVNLRELSGIATSNSGQNFSLMVFRRPQFQSNLDW